MSSVEKRHGSGRRGSGPRLSDAFSDSSSSGSFLDDADREVSSLTERAFRSLCIGDEAVYSDAHLGSSPHERQRAFAQEAPAHSDAAPKQAANETLSLAGGGWGSEVSGTFQGWLAESTLMQQQQQQQLSGLSNGSTEIAWQQKRSTSRVSSLIKAFGGGGGGGGDAFYDPMTPDAMATRDKWQEGGEAWDRSALMSLHHELAEFSAYQQGFRTADADPSGSGSFLRTAKLKASGRFHALSSTNMFLHSEAQPALRLERLQAALLPPSRLSRRHRATPPAGNDFARLQGADLRRASAGVTGSEVTAPGRGGLGSADARS
ncbi:hypothetical protein AALO_G00230170, partial [Alosa alosa]